MLTLRANNDNLIAIGYDEKDPLTRASDGEFVNDATITMTLYKSIASDGAMTASDATLTCASAPFVAGDSGRSIIVHRAGTGGTDLRTTIASVTSTSVVELSDTPSVTVSGATVEMSLANAAGVSVSKVSGLDGQYQGTLESTVPIVAGAQYWLELTATSGARNGFRRIQCSGMQCDERC